MGRRSKFIVSTEGSVSSKFSNNPSTWKTPVENNFTPVARSADSALMNCATIHMSRLDRRPCCVKGISLQSPFLTKGASRLPLQLKATRGRYQLNCNRRSIVARALSSDPHIVTNGHAVVTGQTVTRANQFDLNHRCLCLKVHETINAAA